MHKVTRKFYSLILIILLTTPSIIATDIQSILIKSVGGEKAVERIKKLNSIYLTGTVNLNDSHGRFEYRFKFPNKYLLTLNFPQFTMAEGYDGTTAWQQGLSGHRTKLTGTSRQAILSAIYLNSFAFLFDDSLENKYLIEDTTIVNKSYHQIRFIPSPTDTIIALFDIDLGTREFCTIEQDLTQVTIHEKKYQLIEKIKFPMLTNTIFKDLNFQIEQSVESVELDLEMHDSLFLFQKAKRSNYKLGSETEFTIDFQFHNNHIFVPVTVAGKISYMILDSGADASILHKPFADKINLDSVGTIPAIGVSGSSITKLVKLDSMQIGSLKLYDHVVGIYDLTGIVKGTINKVEFGGILGNDFLSKFPVLINYQERKLTIYNPKQYQATTGGDRIPFNYYNQIPSIECVVGSIKGRFIIDTGNSFGLVLHSHFIDTHNLRDKIKFDTTSERVIVGIGGTSSTQSGVIDSFLIGTQILLNEQIFIPKSNTGLLGSTEIAGNIGNSILNRYSIFFDYLNNEIILYPNSDL